LKANSDGDKIMKVNTSWPKNLLFSCIALVLFASVLEAGASVLWMIRRPLYGSDTLMHDPILHHKWVPNAFWMDHNPKIPFAMYTNAQSWPQKGDIAFAKPAGVFRIFFLGDSNVQGVVRSEERMVSLVQEKLKAKKSILQYQVVNTGTCSYSILPYYMLIKHKIAPYFSPDLVVICVDMTDVPNDYEYRNSVAEFDAEGFPVRFKDSPEGRKVVLTPFSSRLQTFPEALLDFAKSSSKFVFFMDYYMKYWRNKASVSLGPSTFHDYVKGPANWMALQYTPEIESNIAYSMRVLGKAIDILHEHKVKVLVIGVPHYPQFTGEWSAKPHKILETTARLHGADFFNLYEALKPEVLGASRADAYYWAIDPSHFNQKGQALWAKYLLAYFDTHNILP